MNWFGLPVLRPEARVFRLARNTFAGPGSTRPTGEDFVPSSEDRKEATAKGRDGRPLVSVWDSEKATIPLALEHMGDRERIAYEIEVGKVHEVGIEGGLQRFFVVSDPITPAKNLGSAGHCGIAGLERRANEPRPQWRALLDEIACRCRERREA